MVDILINLREREERIKKGRKVMYQIKSYFKKNSDVRCVIMTE
jgi:hypothetical protein